METKKEKLAKRKDEERTFKKGTSLGNLQEEITELKSRIDEMEKNGS